MIFPNRTARRTASVPVSFLFPFLVSVLIFVPTLLVLSCNVATEDGRTYINVRKDAAWAAFDSLEITWKDSVSGAGGTLFDGDPADMAAINKLPADGYQGGKIVVTFKGYKDGTRIYEERRGFDGADPAKVTKEIIPIDGPKIPDPKPNTPKISILGALPDTLVSINDSISFSATAALESGSLKNYAWSYEGRQGTVSYGAATALSGKTAGISGGHRFAEAGTFQVALKVVSDSGSAATAVMGVQVLLDPPMADAGKDITVYTQATVKLQGAAKDNLGRIVRTEWKIGASDYTASGLDTAFKAPSAAQDLPILFRVTDDDGQTAVDTMFVHVIPENESNLTALGVSRGALVPQFSPGVLAYSDTVPNGVASIILMPEGRGVIKVNGIVVDSGEASDPIDLAIAGNAISISVQYGTAAVKTYSLQVYRLPFSLNADLTALSVSAGALSPEFSSAETFYAVSASNATTTTTLTAALADSTSTLTVNGFPLASKAVSGIIFLAIGKNPITLEVTTRSGAKKSYLIEVTRAPNGNAALSALSVAPGALDSVFAADDTSYAVAVGNAATAITVTPVPAAPTSKITVNGKPVSGGAASDSIALAVGPNEIAVVVTAENLAARTYRLTVNRARNGNTELSGLVPSVGVLAPDFNPGVPDYGFQAGFSDSLVRITPSAADSRSTIQVNGKALASGSASEYRKIQVGGNANVFIVVVTAENLAQKVYNVSVDRSPNSVSTLKSLSVSSGTLVRKNALEYADTVSHGTLSVTLAPVASDPNAVVTIDSAAVAEGSASAAIPLAVGDNDIECLVTAQDGTTQTLYTVRITRLALLTRNRMLGSVVSVLDSVEIPLGRPYQQSAPPVTGFHFVKWTTVDGSAAFGDANASATSVTLSLGDARIQAAYDTNTYTLTVNAANCTVARSPDLAAYHHGKPVVLTLTPASGFQFSSWADGSTANPRTVSMISDTVLAAACTAIPIRTLTLGAIPTGSGSVAANPPGPAYFHGTNVTLTPTPAAGYHFVNWTGDLSGSAVPGAVSMTADKGITANFAPDQYTLTVTRAPEIPLGCVTSPTGSVLVGNGVAKTISTTNCKQGVAGCANGTVYLYYDFTGWSVVSGAPVFASAGSASTTVTLSSGDATIKANYAAPRSQCE